MTLVEHMYNWEMRQPAIIIPMALIPGWGGLCANARKMSIHHHVFVSGVERRPAPRRGFRGECCPPTALHRLCVFSS